VSPGTALPYVLRAFQLKVISEMGHAPELTTCVSCGDPSRPVTFFSASSGGVVCGACSRDQPGSRPVGSEALDVLRRYSALPLAELAHIEIETPVRAEVGRLMEEFMTAQMESYRGLKSLKMAAGFK
jgi:DNA repair protein RecO (recombination protein O)